MNFLSVDRNDPLTNCRHNYSRRRESGVLVRRRVAVEFPYAIWTNRSRDSLKTSRLPDLLQAQPTPESEVADKRDLMQKNYSVRDNVALIILLGRRLEILAPHDPVAD